MLELLLNTRIHFGALNADSMNFTFLSCHVGLEGQYQFYFIVLRSYDGLANVYF